jgi:5-methylcytosine-specific restriction endonuclease McrA
MGAEVEHVDPLVVLERYDGACGICGEDVDPFDHEMDHIVPISRGGPHTYANVQPAHRGCNRRKSASVPEAE